MKILLIQPSQKTVYGVVIKPSYAPLGLLYIGACLEKAGHELQFIDLDIDSLDPEKVVEHVIETKPDLICFGSTTATINNALAISKAIKKATNTPILLGGIHATIAGEKVINDNNINFVIKGEGEETIVELANAIEKATDVSTIKGLYFKIKGKTIFTGERAPIEDLDKIPFPARHLLKKPFSYTPPDALQTPVTSIMTSRGCPAACTYCCTKQIFGRRMRFRSIKNVIDEIEHVVKKYGFREIHIMDDCFTVDKQRVLEFRDEIKRRNIKTTFVFSNGIRADQIDEDILTALKDLGVLSVGFGVESGNQQILKNIKKGIHMNTVRKAFKLSKKFGFETWGFFMMGLPGETEETINDTINFAKELDPDFAKFLILKPFPGSEVFTELNRAGRIFDFNYDHYGPYTGPVHDLPGLPKEKILKLQKKALRSFYMRPSKIIKTLARIRSFTQLKLNIQSGMFIIRSMFKK